ncbi:MAG: DUF4260 family protein [Gemmatimonadales bacterium]
MKRAPVATATRVEGAAILVASVAAYWVLEASWGMFWLFLLAPDVCFVACAVSKRVGAMAYNLAHTLAGPLLLGGMAMVVAERGLALAVLIWLAHIGLDRTLGFGLKPVPGR